MQSQLQSLMSAFSSMKEQPQVDSMAKTLYSSGLIKAAGKAAYYTTRTSQHWQEKQKQSQNQFNLL
jgi:hypothetical protein